MLCKCPYQPLGIVVYLLAIDRRIAFWPVPLELLARVYVLLQLPGNVTSRHLHHDTLSYYLIDMLQSVLVVSPDSLAQRPASSSTVDRSSE